MKGKGTLYGVLKCRESMLRHSNGVVAKCDIKGFFMHINKVILWNKLEKFIKQNITDFNKLPWILYYTKLIVFHNPTSDCLKVTPDKDWKLIEYSKSLFNILNIFGLPIGNLTSQLFASFYLTEFDHVMYDIFGDDYGRYVDDFYIIADNIDNIKIGIRIAKQELFKLGLDLHPNKLYIQPVYHGIKFIGSQIKHNRLYIGNGTRSNIINRISYYNNHTDIKYIELHYEQFIQSINSYLGYMKGYNSYNIRKLLVNNIDKNWWNIFYVEGHYEKIVLKTIWKSKRILY